VWTEKGRLKPEARITKGGELVPTMDWMVEILAAFHDFGGWAEALKAESDAPL
jgi:hypothetical protein